MTTAKKRPAYGKQQAELLHQLVQEQGLPESSYAFFFVTGEGRHLPDAAPGELIEETSGFVIDDQGRVFSFWMDWDPQKRAVVLTEWQQVEPEQHWLDSEEYRRARKQVGLPAA